MRKLYLPLALTPKATAIYLHPVTGHSELLVEDTSSRTAIDFLQSLLADVVLTDEQHEFSVADIATPDRDRILANLYISLFGESIKGTIDCKGCDSPFDLDFSLRELLEQYRPQQLRVDPDGTIHADDDFQFRLPTGNDELLIESVSYEQAEKILAERCLFNLPVDESPSGMQEKMNQVAPLLNLELHSVCPECGLAQPLKFDMQSYFLERMNQERGLLIRELHLLALHYHWSQESILSIPRTLRKNYVQLIERHLGE